MTITFDVASSFYKFVYISSHIPNAGDPRCEHQAENASVAF
jgi:hypothetical protein